MPAVLLFFGRDDISSMNSGPANDRSAVASQDNENEEGLKEQNRQRAEEEERLESAVEVGVQHQAPRVAYAGYCLVLYAFSSFPLTPHAVSPAHRSSRYICVNI